MSHRGGAGKSDAMRYPRTGKRGAPQVFPRKLYEILDNESEDTISWTESGHSFVIKDMETFVTSVLMKYFRHQKFSSFQRQLNLYGFRKISKGTETGAYCHEFFARDQTDKLRLVRRTPQVTGRSKAKTEEATSESSSVEPKQSTGVAQVAKSAISRLSGCCKTKHKRSESQGSTNSTSSSASSSSSSSRGGGKPAKIQVARVASSDRDEHEAPLAHASPLDPVLTSQPTLSFSESDSDDSLLHAFAPLGVRTEDSFSPVTSQPGVFGVQLEERSLLSAFSFDVSDLSVSVNKLELGRAGTCPPPPREPAPAAPQGRGASPRHHLPMPKLMPASSAVSSLGFDVVTLDEQLQKPSLDFAESPADFLEPLSAKTRGRSLSISSDDWALNPPRDEDQLPLEGIFTPPPAGLAPATVQMER